MRKATKLTAITTSIALCMGLSLSAYSDYTDTSFFDYVADYSPEGYTEISDGGILFGEIFDFGYPTDEYELYRNEDDHFIICFAPTIDNTSISVDSAIGKEAESLLSAVGFDLFSASTSPDGTITYFDMCDLYSGQDLNTTATSEKFDAINTIYDELQSIGTVYKADYMRYQILYTFGSYGSSGGEIAMKNIPEGEEENIIAIYQKHIDDETAEPYIFAEGNNGVFRCMLKNSSNVSFDDALAITTELSATYPDAFFYPHIGFDDNGAHYVSETIDLTESAPAEIICGDVNLDGKVSVIDVVNINKYNAKIIDFTDAQKQNANCCYDGIIDSRDGTALMMFLVDKAQALPIVIE